MAQTKEELQQKLDAIVASKNEALSANPDADVTAFNAEILKFENAIEKLVKAELKAEEAAKKNAAKKSAVGDGGEAAKDAGSDVPRGTKKPKDAPEADGSTWNAEEVAKKLVTLHGKAVAAKESASSELAAIEKLFEKLPSEVTLILAKENLAQSLLPKLKKYLDGDKDGLTALNIASFDTISAEGVEIANRMKELGLPALLKGLPAKDWPYYPESLFKKYSEGIKPTEKANLDAYTKSSMTYTKSVEALAALTLGQLAELTKFLIGSVVLDHVYGLVAKMLPEMHVPRGTSGGSTDGTRRRTRSGGGNLVTGRKGVEITLSHNGKIEIVKVFGEQSSAPESNTENAFSLISVRTEASRAKDLHSVLGALANASYKLTGSYKKDSSGDYTQFECKDENSREFVKNPFIISGGKVSCPSTMKRNLTDFPKQNTSLVGGHFKAIAVDAIAKIFGLQSWSWKEIR